MTMAVYIVISWKKTLVNKLYLDNLSMHVETDKIKYFLKVYKNKLYTTIDYI